MPATPMPADDFKAFAEHQKRLLFEESESFFARHNLRLKKYLLPVPLPDWAATLDQVLDTGREHEPYSTIYRHQHFLKTRVLRNWSYIETIWNVSENPRNKNIPFDLRPLTKEIIKQLDSTNADIIDPEFSGLLVTLNTSSFVEEPSHDLPNGTGAAHDSDPSDPCPEGPDGGVTDPQGGAARAAHRPSGAGGPAQPDGPPLVKSKIIAGALVECLMTNERCIRCIWLHPHLSKHSSRVLLQTFLPRLMLEMFNVPSVMTDEGPSTYHKFAYAMHNDLDMFPRQCWLLLASIKKMSLPRHYEPSTFEDHPVDLEYGECHMDEAGHLLLPEFSGIVDDGVLLSVGSEASVRSVSCNCYNEKLKKSIDAQAWLDRLVGCTESYMCLMLPKRSERESLGLHLRDGWRDLIAPGLDRPLLEELLDLLPTSSRDTFSHLYDPAVATVSVRCNANLNSDLEEWCKLRREDLIDVTSDTEAYMNVDVNEDEYALSASSKRSRSRV
ncbi:erythrocyte membrane protein, putative [Babesia caballi]|uniref:Erythrocyte membrane protein, putative n=1 Tax=Babesia caballi TaxID=5871 RepID=A0AAV4LU30_BABCB|nr:erythrocyte membrane protein, putative [Babesia caballi]